MTSVTWIRLRVNTSTTLTKRMIPILIPRRSMKCGLSTRAWLESTLWETKETGPQRRRTMMKTMTMMAILMHRCPIWWTSQKKTWIHQRPLLKTSHRKSKKSTRLPSPPKKTIQRQQNKKTRKRLQMDQHPFLSSKTPHHLLIITSPNRQLRHQLLCAG